MKRNFTATVQREGQIYVAQCLEVDVASQGASEEQALANLSEALARALRDAVEPDPRATGQVPSTEGTIGG